MEVLELERRAAERVGELIDGVPPDGWEAPTPCAGWTVRDLVAHLVAGNVKYAALAAGGDFVPGAPEVELGDDPASAYRDTTRAMLDAWRRPGALEREAGLPRGQRGPAEVLAWVHLAETLGHGWDVARATQQEPGFDRDVVDACLAECRRRMPPRRGEGSPFADATETVGTEAIDQLAAWLGRDVEPWASRRSS